MEEQKAVVLSIQGGYGKSTQFAVWQHRLHHVANIDAVFEQFAALHNAQDSRPLSSYAGSPSLSAQIFHTTTHPSPRFSDHISLTVAVTFFDN